jgi:hypothetical protein
MVGVIQISNTSWTCISRRFRMFEGLLAWPLDAVRHAGEKS